MKNIALFCLLFRLSWLPAQETRSLEVGDPAPPLEVLEWLQGEPVDGLEEGKVYIIDLWAIWCTPCLASMPYLSHLQERYADEGLVVIGLTSEDAWGNTLEAVKDFLAERDELMQYRVAWAPPSTGADSLQGIFNHPWMQGVGTQSLPMAFVIDREGRIAYMGDPHTVGRALEQIMAGAYDLEAARDRYRLAQEGKELYERIKESLAGENRQQATQQATRFVEEYGEVMEPKYLSGLATRIAESEDPGEAMLDIALQAARRAVIATNFESPGHLDALATVYFARGDTVAAVITERLAVSLSEGGMRRAQLKKLARFREALEE